MSPEPDETKAESYFNHALTIARAQQAKSWELRAAMSVRVRGSFQLPTISPPAKAPNAMSVRRESPRHITVLPGGGSLARAR